MDIFNSGTGKRKIRMAAMAAVGCCLLMVIFPTTALNAARKGVFLWLSNVLPALLPFFICANFLQGIGVISFLKAGAFPFVMSVLSGYPMGAKIVGDLRRGGEISVGEAKRLMSFCSTSGPAFMVSAVGVGMLGSGFLGGIIAVSHYAGALLNGLFYGAIYGRDAQAFPKRPAAANKGLLELFTESIIMSFKSLGIILAYIVLFMFAAELLQISGVLPLFESREVQALLTGILEMTVGCGAVAECGAADSTKCILCTAILSWGGLSVLGQTMSMLSGTEISFGYVVRSKAAHCVFSTIIAFFLCGLVL